MNPNDSTEDLFGPAIHTYSRAQAIADGALIDLTAKAKEHGVSMPFKFPLACTAAIWAWIVPSDDEQTRDGQSIAGRLWDVLWLLLCAVRRSGGGSNLQYDVIFVRRESSKLRRPVVKIKSICGPGDDAEPVITLMLPEED
jgi:hypothetical protein